MRRSLPGYQNYNGVPMYNQNSAPRYQQVQQQVQPQYSQVQYQPYHQRQYGGASGGAAQSYSVPRPLAQYHQQQQYMPAQHVQQQQAQYAQQPQYSQYQQRFLEQLQQVRPNDVSAYHASQGQAVQQAAIQSILAQVAAGPPSSGLSQQGQGQAQVQQYVNPYRQYQQYGALQYQQQQQHEQEQQMLAQQEEEEQMQQQNLLHNPAIQKRLLNQLYETFPPPATVTNEEKRNDYTINQYYNFLQNQHEQILSDQQSAMQRYGNSQTAAANAQGQAGASAARYSPASAVSSTRYSGRNSQYTFG